MPDILNILDIRDILDILELLDIRDILNILDIRDILNILDILEILDILHQSTQTNISLSPVAMDEPDAPEEEGDPGPHENGELLGPEGHTITPLLSVCLFGLWTGFRSLTDSPQVLARGGPDQQEL